MKNEWPDQGQIFLLFSLIDPKVVEDCFLVEREASERTFHCQLIWNKRSDTDCILKVEPRELTVGPDVGCERNQVVKDDSMIFGLNTWRNGVTTTEMAKTKRGGMVGVGRGVSRVSLGHANLKSLVHSASVFSVVRRGS